MAQNWKNYKDFFSFLPIALVILGLVIFFGVQKTKEIENQKKPGGYPLHENITTTVFWVGEEATDENGYIANDQSAWDEDWQEHYGGVDSPEKRYGHNPADFTPQENPFYFALPYNDIDDEGDTKKSALSIVYWGEEKEYPEGQSMLKNRWIKISKNDKTAYAQWEDVGPYHEDDSSYVFGNSSPKNRTSPKAGLDVSPAVKSYLGLSDTDRADWQFIDEKEVPDGAWKEIITTSHPEALR